MKDEDVSTLVKYRLEQARTVLEDARFLFEGKRSPQSIINRSYYAMFYSVLALLQKIGKIPAKYSGVIGLFDKEFVHQGKFPKKLSKDLHKAFELRQSSDYKAIESLSMRQAENILNAAAEFVDAVTDFFEKEKPTDEGK